MGLLGTRRLALKYLNQPCRVCDITERLLGTKWQHSQPRFSDFHMLIFDKQEEKLGELHVYIFCSIPTDCTYDASLVQLPFKNRHVHLCYLRK